MELIKKTDILRHLRKQGLRMSHEELRQYLKMNWERIKGLRLQHHENIDKNRINNNWYEIRSNVTQERANRLVAEQIVRASITC